MAKSFTLKESIDIDTFVGMSDTDEENVREQFDLELNNLYEKYSNPDDFADDWEDDFDSWEDAYDYWEDECD